MGLIAKHSFKISGSKKCRFVLLLYEFKIKLADQVKCFTFITNSFIRFNIVRAHNYNHGSYQKLFLAYFYHSELSLADIVLLQDSRL